MRLLAFPAWKSEKASFNIAGNRYRSYAHPMTSPDNRVEYIQRMHRALEYIDMHLERPIELAELAGVAHFSPFHFHRLFSAWLGETFGEYVRRRQLEVAASRLVAIVGRDNFRHRDSLGLIAAVLAICVLGGPYGNYEATRIP